MTDKKPIVIQLLCTKIPRSDWFKNASKYLISQILIPLACEIYLDEPHPHEDAMLVFIDKQFPKPWFLSQDLSDIWPSLFLKEREKNDKAYNLKSLRSVQSRRVIHTGGK